MLPGVKEHCGEEGGARGDTGAAWRIFVTMEMLSLDSGGSYTNKTCHVTRLHRSKLHAQEYK